jgi:uncharacterized integral membrane protein
MEEHVKSPDASFLRRLGWRGMVSIALGIVGGVLVLQNFDTVRVQFLTFTVDIWLWLLLVVFFVLGMLLDGVVRRLYRSLRKKE